MTTLNRVQWTQLWLNAHGLGDGSKWFEILATRYAEPHRHYHTAQHIAECLAEFDSARHLASQPVAVELALWFHDVVYDTHAGNNEEQSALLAEHCLSDAGADSDLHNSVRELVLVTKTHNPEAHVEAPLLVDIDLSILGQPEERFREYESQIRQEYSWVPDEIFHAKRSEILQRFLSRNRIYSTDWFFRKYEEQARANLKSSLVM